MSVFDNLVDIRDTQHACLYNNSICNMLADAPVGEHVLHVVQVLLLFKVHLMLQQLGYLPDSGSVHCVCQCRTIHSRLQNFSKDRAWQALPVRLLFTQLDNAGQKQANSPAIPDWLRQHLSCYVPHKTVIIDLDLEGDPDFEFRPWCDAERPRLARTEHLYSSCVSGGSQPLFDDKVSFMAGFSGARLLIIAAMTAALNHGPHSGQQADHCRAQQHSLSQAWPTYTKHCF